MVKQLTILTNTDTNVNEIQVVAVDVLTLLKERHTTALKTFSGKVETLVRELITETCTNVSKTARKLEIELDSEIGLTDTIDIEIKAGTYILNLIKELSVSYDFCFKMTRKGDGWLFSMYRGENRSVSQDALPFVEFSEQWHNLKTTNYVQDYSTHKTTAYVEGADGVVVIVNDELSGTERKEIYVDATSLSRKDENENEIPLETYQSMLIEEGKKALNENSASETFTGDVVNTRLYEYKKHFNKGDIITVRNNVGLIFNARITQVKRAYDINGEDITLSVEYREVN